jgi:CRP-like cAMP-binding protein
MGALPDLEPSEELRRVAPFAELPREILTELTIASTQRRVLAGATLLDQGAIPTSLDVLARGAAKMVRTVIVGGAESVVVLHVVRAPALLSDPGLFDGEGATATTVALRASQLIAIDRRAVLRIAAQNPPFARALLTDLAHVVRRTTRRIDEVASGPVDERVRHLLEGLALEQGTPFGQGRFIAIPLRRRDIACMVNATTETVSRLLARFEREGQVRSTRDGIWWKVDAPSTPTQAESRASGTHLKART